MCGRYGRIGEGTWLGGEWGKEMEVLGKAGYQFDIYNAAPKQIQPVITSTKPHKLQPFLWGLIPHDSLNDSPKYPYFNAKAENLAQVYPWKRIFPKQRCIVPANFFFEWPKINGKAKKGEPPHLFQLKGRVSFSFAGIWDAWKNPETGEYKPSFTIITIEPNSLLKPFHDRMPVILSPGEEEIWMNLKSGLEELQSVLIPFDPELMEEFPVSPLLGNTRNNEPRLIEKIAWKTN